MLTGSETLYLSTTTQLLLTVCLVMLLWALYTRLQRFEFFRWWAWAWTAFAVYLAAATISLRLGPAWTLQKASLVWVLVILRILQPVLLVFGGLSWRTTKKALPAHCFGEGRRSPRRALICFALSFCVAGVSAGQFCGAQCPRTSGATPARCFSVARYFGGNSEKSRSYAAAITSIFCLAYACDQLLYFFSFSEMLASHWNIQFPGLLHA